MSKGKVLETTVSIAGTLDPSLQKAVNNATGILGKIDFKSIAVAAGAAGLAVGIGKAVSKSVDYLMELGEGFHEVEKTIRVGTGATGENLEALVNDFDEVYKSVPTSMEDAGKAIADFNTRLGLSGPELQNLSKQALQVSDMLGEDLGGVIEESSQAFKQWGLASEDMGGAMDYMYKVSQDTGVGFTDLMSRMQNSGVVFQDLGYNFEEAAAMVGQLDKAGINADQVFTGLKKGLGNIAKSGGDAKEGMEEYFHAIQNATTESEAIAIATEVFGAATAATMSQAVRSGALDVENLTQALSENGETISGAAEDTYSFSDRLQVFKQQAEVALQPLASTLFDGLTDLLPVVASLMEGLLPAISQIVALAAPFIEDFLGKMVELLLPIIPMVIELATSLIEQLLPPIMELAGSVFPLLMTILQALMPILSLLIGLLGPILDIFVAIITPIIEMMSVALTPLIEVITQLINFAIVPLQTYLGVLQEVFGSVFSFIASYVGEQIGHITGVLTGIIDFVQNVFTGNWAGAWEAVKSIFGNIFGGLVALAKAPINGVISVVNGLLRGLNNIKIPSWVPGVGGKGINIPLIPQLAKGGFTDGISIAGEAGMEAVISFDPSVRGANIKYWGEAGRMLGVLTPNIQRAMNFSHTGVSAQSSTDGVGHWAQSGQLISAGTSLSTMIQNNNTSSVASITIAPNITVSKVENDEDVIAKIKEQLYDFRDMLEEWFGERQEGAFDENPIVY